MKTTIFKVIFAVGALFALANCSKSDDSSSATVCSANQVYTQQGCLSSLQCNGTGGWNGSQCLPMINNGYNNGGLANGMVCTQIGPLPVGACAGLNRQQYPGNYGFYQGNCYPEINQGYNTGYNNGYNTGMNSQCNTNTGYNNGGMNGTW